MQLKTCHSAALTRHGGFTLLEVLIAIVVLSLGLLGLAGLQYASLQYNHSAHLRSQATVLAYDLIDRMRANRAAVLQGGAYDGNDEFVATECNEAFVPNVNQTIAQQDIAAWRNDLACLLPGGQGSLERDQRTVTVRVRWIDSRDADDAPDDEEEESPDTRIVTFRVISDL